MGAGIPRILQAYGEGCFKSTDHFIRVILPISAYDTAHDVGSVSKAVRTLLACIEGEVDKDALQSLIGIKRRTYSRSTYIKPALEEGNIEFTLPGEKQS